tara:strand:+ start:13459 stop:13674 length:216 start_codon:yes stop_codon:yes gene_type:complete
MSFVPDTMILNQSPSLGDRFASLRTTLIAAAQRRKKYNQVFNELSALSNRDLADIGIARRNIPDIARQSAV